MKKPQCTVLNEAMRQGIWPCSDHRGAESSFAKARGTDSFGQFFTRSLDYILQHIYQVGLVTLRGLVSKNGILIVQFAHELQRRVCKT